MRSQVIQLVGVIRGKARPRVTKNGTHKPAKYSKCLKSLALQASRQRRFTTERPTAVRVQATIYVERPTRRPPWVTPTSWAAGEHIYCPVTGKGRPDIDNAVGTILDAFNSARLWADDCQVAELLVRQVLAREGGGPGATVIVTELAATHDGGHT